EDDQLRLEGDDEDAELEDEDKDIKPTFAKDKAGRSEASNAQPNGPTKPVANGYAYDDDDLSEGEVEEDEDYDDVDPEEEWNLRKCSAASL
nr:hypothetical protein [Tanacetum cinerariifolium]